MMKIFTSTLAVVAAMATTALAQTFNGNGGGGFGGPVGQGSLNFSVSGTTVTGTFTSGNPASGFNDVLVIYIDSVAGGFSDTSAFTDTADYHRRGISGFDNGTRALLTFDSGFQADYAIALAQNFGGLWNLANTADFAFAADLGISPMNDPNAASYTFTFDLANIGLVEGQGFNITTTYLNPNGPYRSNEAIGHTLSGTPADANGNFGTNDALASGFAAVPEPSTISLLAGAVLVGAWRLRRRVG